jgi:hypothetical protein
MTHACGGGGMNQAWLVEGGVARGDAAVQAAAALVKGAAKRPRGLLVRRGGWGGGDPAVDAVSALAGAAGVANKGLMVVDGFDALAAAACS